MKKVFALISLIFISAILTTMPVFSKENLSVNAIADESYLILLEKPAETAMSSNINILSSEILTTLYNEKNQIIVRTLAPGIARLYVITDTDTAVIEFNVRANSDADYDDEISPKSKIVKAIAKIDKISDIDKNEFILDLPPVLRGEH